MGPPPLLQSRLCKAPAAGTRSLSLPRCMSKQGCKGPPPSQTATTDKMYTLLHTTAVGGAICAPPIPVPRLLANEVELRIPSLRRRWDGRESYRARWRKGGEGCLYRTSPLPLPPSPHPPFLAANFGFPSSHPPASCWLLLLAISQLLPPPPLSPVRPPLRATQSEEDKWQQFGGGRSERGGKRLWGRRGRGEVLKRGSLEGGEVRRKEEEDEKAEAETSRRKEGGREMGAPPHTTCPFFCL